MMSGYTSRDFILGEIARAQLQMNQSRAIHPPPLAPLAQQRVIQPALLPNSGQTAVQPSKQAAAVDPTPALVKGVHAAEEAASSKPKAQKPQSKKGERPLCGTSTVLFAREARKPTSLGAPEPPKAQPPEPATKVPQSEQKASSSEAKSQKAKAPEPPKTPEAPEQAPSEPASRASGTGSGSSEPAALAKLKATPEWDQHFGKTEGRGILFIKGDQVIHYQTMTAFKEAQGSRLPSKFPQVGSSITWRGATLYATKSSFRL